MTTVAPVRPDQLEQVRSVLARSPYKPCRALRLPPDAALEALWLAEVADAMSDAHAAVFVACSGQTVLGVAVCAEQDWETRVLEHKAAVLRHLVVPADDPHGPETLDRLLDQILAWSKARGVELLSCKTCTDDSTSVHALERHGFLLMDTLLDYVYDARRELFPTVPRPQPVPGCTIRQATAADRAALARVAENAFGRHFGRFHADHRLPREVAARVYREWIHSACDGYADYLLLAEMEGTIAAFSVWKKPSAREQQFGLRLGHYSIGAVHHDFAGRGVFGALTWAGMAALDGTVDWIEGPTHVNNYPVQRGYEKLRWRIGGARHTLHCWLTDQPRLRLPLAPLAA
jgi:hypothetical protein